MQAYSHILNLMHNATLGQFSMHESHRDDARSSLIWTVLLFLLMGTFAMWPAPDAARGLAAYVPLHTGLEVAAVTVAVMVFGITWNTQGYRPDGRALMLGIGFLGVALLDLAHLLAYPGMPDFITPSGAEKAISYWLGARTLAALALISAALIPRSKSLTFDRGRRYLLLAGVLTLVIVILWVVLLHPEQLPRTFIPNSGLTRFKVNFEYALITAYLCATVLFAMHIGKERRFNASGMMAAAATMAMSEFFFTMYANVTDIYNLMGHVYKIAAYGFLYRAVFVESVRHPYQRLLTTEAQLVATLDALPDLLFELDRFGNYLDVHATEGRKFAAPASQLLGRNIRDVMPHDAAMTCLGAIEKAFKDGMARGTRITLEVPDGRRHFELSVSRRSNAGPSDQSVLGTSARFLVLSRDVTELVNQEQQIELEARLNAALLELETRSLAEEESSLLQFGIDLAEKLTDSQIAFAHFVNPDQESIELMTWSSATLRIYSTTAIDHRHYPMGRAADWEEAWNLQQPVVINEYPSASIKTELQQGHAHLQRFISLPVLEAGVVRMLVGVGNKPLDYTSNDVQALQLIANAIWNKAQRHRQEANILRLSTAMAQSPNSVVITDVNANIQYVNQAFTNISGYSANEVIGHNPRLLQSGQTPEHIYQEMWQRLSSGQAWQGELSNRRKDGSIYSEQTLIYPIRNSFGQVVNYLAHKEDITKRKEAEVRIHELSHFDQLTGLPNRSSMEEHLQQELSHARRDSPLVLLWLNLDSFKAINDSLGYAVGDLLLVEIANRLRKEVGDKGYLARMSGDTFIAVLSQTGHQGATLVAQRLLDAVQQPCQFNGHDLSVSASVGMTVCPFDGTTMVELLNHAEVAMYRVKEEGRNGLRFYASEMQANSERTLAVLQALKLALTRNQLHVVYQPQMDLSSGHMVGAEVLVRWTHPELGSISPGEFIPLAERNGLIVPIGNWILREVMRQVRSWKDVGLQGLVLAVNLSAVQFAQSGLVEDLLQMVDEVGIGPDGLELELTEAVALSDPVSAAKTIHTLQEAGFKISIDDFGTGYSSMSYLKRFAVDKIKIDQSFVREVHSDPDDQAIVRAIVQMAHGLGTTTIAEGVETQEQVDFLQACGCDEIQGYWYSRPLDAGSFEDFARSRLPSLNVR